VHLAIHLSQQHGKRVLLIDAHPALGHACVYLGIDGSRYHFNEVVRSVSRLDTELLRGFVAKHASGADVLSSPDRRTSASVLDPEAITRTLDFLRSEYDYVLIDCDVPVTPDSMAIVESSNIVYLVATPDVGAVRDLARYMEILTQADGGAENVQVVLNRVGSRYAIDPVQIEKAMGRSIDIRLPNCFADLIRSGNRGEPISPKQDKSDFTDRFAKWTSDLVGAAAPAAKAKKEPKKFALWK
jgi:pilus assembly protein CpaE